MSRILRIKINIDFGEAGREKRKGEKPPMPEV
jgi:hypothetical protein